MTGGILSRCSRVCAAKLDAMKNQARLEIKVEKTAGGRQALIRFRPDLKRQGGQTVAVKLVLFCKVDHSNPINKKVELLTDSFKVSEPLHTLRYELPRRFYTYEGSRIRLGARVSILIGDDRIAKKLEAPLELGNIHLSGDLDETINPPDEKSFLKVVGAIPSHQKSKLLLMGGGGLLLLLLAEQFFTRTPVLGRNFELVAYVCVFLVLGAGVLLLKAYAKARNLWDGADDSQGYFRIPATLSRGLRSKKKINRRSRFLVSDWISGKAETDLHGVRLRVVVGNIEKGQCREYEESSTSETPKLVEKDVSVITRGIVLYDKTVKQLPAGLLLAEYFKDPLDFEPVFTDLYPPDMVGTTGSGGRFKLSSTHGLGYHLEFQLMHPELTDLKYVVESRYFDPFAFYREPVPDSPPGPRHKSEAAGDERPGPASPPPPPPPGE